jgi:hypothetical protein
MTDAHNTQSSHDPRSEEYLKSEVSQIALMSLEVYQRQHAILDRYWAYFNQYSLMMLTLSVLAVAFREYPVIQNIKLAIVVVPVVLYVMLFISNHVSVKLTVQELQYMKSMAVGQTRIRLQTSDLGTIRRWHAFMGILMIAIYIISWSYALWWGK